MSLIIPHRTSYQRHVVLPWLWRVKCSCGWSALVPNEAIAQKAADDHKFEEDPFPDMEWELPEDKR